MFVFRCFYILANGLSASSTVCVKVIFHYTIEVRHAGQLWYSMWDVGGALQDRIHLPQWSDWCLMFQLQTCLWVYCNCVWGFCRISVFTVRTAVWIIGPFFTLFTFFSIVHWEFMGSLYIGHSKTNPFTFGIINKSSLNFCL